VLNFGIFVGIRMIAMINSKKESIYKYITLDRNHLVLESLKRGRIKYCLLNYLNDKYENNFGGKRKKNWIENYSIMKHELITKYNNLDFSFLPAEVILSLYILNKYNCLNGQNNLTEVFNYYIEKSYSQSIYLDILEERIQQRLGLFAVLSLSSEINNQLMWSHYANNEKGIVIGFNANHKYFELIKEVNYTNNRPNVKKYFRKLLKKIILVTDEDIDKWICANIVNKPLCWKYEKEKRLIKTIDFNCKDKIYTEEVPFSAWQSIYLGQEISILDQYRIMEYFKRNNETRHIKIYRVYRDSNKYEYHSVEV
jgi:hypothetical protein